VGPATGEASGHRRRFKEYASSSLPIGAVAYQLRGLARVRPLANTPKAASLTNINPRRWIMDELPPLREGQSVRLLGPAPPNSPLGGPFIYLGANWTATMPIKH
jgi:hypothetical protein